MFLINGDHFFILLLRHASEQKTVKRDLFANTKNALSMAYAKGIHTYMHNLIYFVFLLSFVTHDQTKQKRKMQKKEIKIHTEITCNAY